MFCLRETGGAEPLRMQKRLEYYPAAVTKYRRPGGDGSGVHPPAQLQLLFTVALVLVPLRLTRCPLLPV